MKKVFLIFTILFSFTSHAQSNDSVLNFIFLSDVHFGLTKKEFRNKQNVDAFEVNKALVQSINFLQSSKQIGKIESVIITGDIANRMEAGVQNASLSWKQFLEIYDDSLHIKNQKGNKAELWVTPGNHDMSNAIGFHRTMKPKKDAGSMIGIYNLMFNTKYKTLDFDSTNHRIHYSKDLAGVHFVFLSLYLDSAERVWLDQDLSRVSTTTPVLLFAHSIPDVESRFFQNPNGIHDINEIDKFENLTPEMFKDGNSIQLEPIIEQQGFANYIKNHPNIKAYFHGHENFTEFYIYQGPDNDIHLPCIRVDSPMKGRESVKDETKLSFQILSFNKKSKKLLIKECFWNTKKMNESVSWGQHFELSL